MSINFEALRRYIEKNYGSPKTIYLDLYLKRIKLVVYSENYNEYIFSQIPYVISAVPFDKVDATIILWQEKDEDAPEVISEYDESTETYYYGVKNLDYEEFIKQGHFLVQIFYRILKTDTSSLVHGAVVGMDDKGVLMCARGQRGKSTLTVLSMFLGMEYVSDDYLILERTNDNQILASPIYSIITLSPEMCDRLKEKLQSSVLLGGNARKDKYVYNISNMHGSFRKHYPIKMIMFPEIVATNEPYIRTATTSERSRAITQLIHSTTLQMNDMKDSAATLKLMHMVDHFDCYYIGLSQDIEKNSELLKQFVKGEGENYELQT